MKRKIWALLVLAFSLASLAHAAESAPKIVVEPMSFGFGKVLQNKTVHKDFLVRNLGTEELKIGRVSTSCGCTAALTDTDVVKPGATTTLRVDLETRSYSGKLERKILVDSNDPTKPRLEITVSATVVAQ